MAPMRPTAVVDQVTFAALVAVAVAISRLLGDLADPFDGGENPFLVVRLNERTTPRAL
jgi:hypothetical protein